MPIYEYKCMNGHKFEKFLKMADSDEEQFCECGRPGHKQVTAARVVADYAGYECPITGDWIEGRAAHRENLAKHGCRVFEEGEREQAAQYAARQDAQMDAAVEATVDEFIGTLDGRAKDRLAAEMDAGLDVAYVRSDAVTTE